MLQRQLRVGDIVDDYCPRERRLTDHAIVAMVGETIRQTRCTTCDAEHEYKNAKIPVSRKKKTEIPLPPKAVAVAAAASPADDEAELAVVADPEPPVETAVIEHEETAVPPPSADATPEPVPVQADGQPPALQHDGPVHRRLIRATLPRVEGQEVTRPIPEFTMHRVPAGRGGNFSGKGFRHGAGNQQRQGGRSAHGGGNSFGSRGQSGGQGHGRSSHRSHQGGHGGHRPNHGPGSGSGRRKKH